MAACFYCAIRESRPRALIAIPKRSFVTWPMLMGRGTRMSRVVLDRPRPDPGAGPPASFANRGTSSDDGFCPTPDRSLHLGFNREEWQSGRMRRS